MEKIRLFLLRLFFMKEFQMLVRDELTNVFNRRYLNENKDRYRVFVFIDIDNFKQFNDAKGHLEGDRILKELSEILKSYHPEPVRFAGDEFVLPYSRTLSIQELDRSISGIKRNAEQNGIRLSIGISDSLSGADKIMYEAKRRAKAAFRMKEMAANCD